jgi:hypothetical protein
LEANEAASKRNKQELDLLKPKLSTLCYAHAAPRQPEQLPDYIHMYAHIERLAILHISTHTLFVHEKRRRRMLLFPESGPKKDFRVTASLNRDPTPTLNRS